MFNSWTVRKPRAVRRLGLSFHRVEVGADFFPTPRRRASDRRDAAATARSVPPNCRCAHPKVAIGSWLSGSWIMAVHLIVAKLLRDELTLRGIRSLTVDESEAIAARIFERITELELELAARDFNSTRWDKPT